MYIKKISTQKFLFQDVHSAVGTIFSLIGLVFLCIGMITLMNASRFYAHALPVEGVISHISPGKQVTVTYEINGQPQSAVLGFHSSNMQTGDPISLYYDADQPSVVRTKSSQVLCLTFLGVGGLLSITGLSLVAFSIHRKKKNRHLKEHGQRIEALIVNVAINTLISSNYRHPYILDCRYQDGNGSTHCFHSGPIWYNPEEFLGTYIPVYVERNNYNTYFVDIDVLPNRPVS